MAIPVDNDVLFRVFTPVSPSVVFLCGPPRSGKDTLARALVRAHDEYDLVRIHKMAAILDDMTRPLFQSDLAFRTYR
jgi:adenylylsulfate kinase-like enzyme